MSVPAAFIGIILIWSTTPLAIKWGSEGSDFLFAVFMRMAVGTLLCMLVVWLMRVRLPWDRTALRAYLAAALGHYGSMMLVYWGAQFVPSGLISVLFGMSPLLTALLAAVVLQQRRLSPQRVLGMLLGLAGLAVVFGSGLALGGDSGKGIAAVLMSVMLYCVSALWSKHSGSHLSPLAQNTGGLVIAVVAYALSWALLADHAPQVTAKGMASILYLAVLGTALGFNLYFYVLKHVEASLLMLVTLITPVLALWLGVRLNGEQLPLPFWAGSLLILLGLSVHQWGARLVRVTRGLPLPYRRP